MQKIIHGDCLEVLRRATPNSIDAIVTDPPYELGFMGKSWDSTGIANNVELWKECLRVLKPGGHLLAFSGTRTYHRMASAIEDAGFEVRDMIEWVYGCLSEDTEILTKDGWKGYNTITGNCPVYCYNVDKDIFEYHLPTKYFLYENKHTAYRIQSDYTDQIVSRNHRVAVEQNGRIIFKYAETLKQQENIPVLESMPEMGETFGNTYERTSHKEQILLGLCVKSYIREKEMKTEGYKLYVGEDMSGMLKAIYDEEEETLKVLLEQMQLNSEMKGVSEALTQVKELMDRTIQTVIQSEDVMTELQVLEKLRNSYEEEMKVCKSDDKICEMSEGVYGDGEEGLICNGTQIESGNGDMKTFKEGGVCASHKSQCGRQQNGEFNVIQDELRTQELGELKKYTTTLATITEVEYDGYVWCVEVPTGCFVARRNGKIFITGNSGFPKSLNIGKAVDKLLGNEREEYIDEDFIKRNPKDNSDGVFESGLKDGIDGAKRTKGTSKYEGWGTALKPAHEPICMARKPIEGTVAENCLKYGTGGINIDESRVGTEEDITTHSRKTIGIHFSQIQAHGTFQSEGQQLGRFPANLIHDGSDEVKECFPESNSSARPNCDGKNYGKNTQTLDMKKDTIFLGGFNDKGNASRFFKSIIYQAKASKSERNKGLDSIVLVDILRVWNEKNTTKEEKLIRLMVTGISPQKVIAESGVQLKNANEWNTCLFGKHLMEKYQEDIKSITKTETNSITTSQTLNWLTHLLTNEYTVGANLEMENGGNLVANAGNSNTLIITINEAMELALGVKDVVLGTQLKISVKEGSNIHSTVKPVALMEYLIKMVTREGQIVLDPFAGSGTTLLACKNLGRGYVGIEREEEYIKIINARLGNIL